MFRTRLLSTAAIMAISAPAAFADISAEDVLEAWRSQFASLGQTLSIADQTRDGDTLVLRDMRLEMVDDAYHVVGLVPEVRLTEESGEVEVRFSDTATYASTYSMPVGATGELESVTATATVNMSSLVALVSGSPEAMDYTFSADEIGYRSDPVYAEDVLVSPEVDTVMTGIDGTANTSTANDRSTLRTEVAIKQVTVVSATDEAMDGNDFAMSIALNDIQATASSDAPATNAASGMAAMFGGDTNVDATYTIGRTEGSFEMDGSDGQFAVDFTSASSELTATIEGGLVDYNTTSIDNAMSVSGSSVPFPELVFSIGEMRAGVAMPMTPTDVPVDAGFRLALVDLALPDTIWGMLDPMGQLPHDPATVEIDVDAAVTSRVNFLDPQNIKSMEDSADVPGALHNVTLNRLFVSLAGAMLSGQGDVAVDPDSLVSGGMPSLDGTLSFRLDGANGLMERLVAMGLLPPEQVMGFKMMLGMFTVPVGNDQLTADIEFAPDGTITANGQPLPF